MASNLEQLAENQQLETINKELSRDFLGPLSLEIALKISLEGRRFSKIFKK